MKKQLFIFILLLCSFIGFSQSQLEVHNNGNHLYVTHTVVPKENFYSIGRLYKIAPKDIAAYNNLDMNKGLSVGQTIMIPLQAENFSQSASEGTPVYYVVGDKEGLYRVSLKNNKVLMANLRKWNHLTNDNISAGTKLIVGYLTAVKPSESGNSALAKATTEANSNPAPVASTAIKNNTASVAQAPKKEDPVVTKKEEEKPAAVKSAPPANTAATTAAVTSDAGYFKSLYDQQMKTAAANKDQTVTSGIFKTASGWQDNKYYALLDGVEPGSIIRIINPTNNKAIYAKVLGQMSGIRQNQGLDLRISNAGANALDIADADKFVVRITY